MDTLFQISNLTAIPFWLLMVFAPRWSWTKRVVGSPYLIVPAALLYTVAVLPGALAAFPTLANPTLESVRALLGSPSGATVAWVHFLAFDLFVGRWAYLDSLERGLHPVPMGLILFTILMFGPMGFVLYLIVRGVVPAQTKGLQAAR